MALAPIQSPIQLNRTATVFDTVKELLSAGVHEREFTIEGETILLSLEVDSLAAGSVDLAALTQGDPESTPTPIITFPTVTGPTGTILIRKAAVSLSRVVIRLTIVGSPTLKVWVRPISIGETSVRIQGAVNFAVTRTPVTGAATPLIAVSLEDRSGLCFKNLGPGELYLAETALKATSADGYPLGVGASFSMDIGAGATVYASSASTSDVAVMEGGG